MKTNYTVKCSMAARAISNFPGVVDPETQEVTKTPKEMAYESLGNHILDWYKQQAGGAILAEKSTAVAEEDLEAIGTLEVEHQAVLSCSVTVTDEDEQ